MSLGRPAIPGLRTLDQRSVQGIVDAIRQRLVAIEAVADGTAAQVGTAGQVAVQADASIAALQGQISKLSQSLAGASDAFMQFTQDTAADVWVIRHTLRKFPSVVVVDSGGTVVEGLVNYESETQISLRFSSAFAGTAYLN